MRLAWSRPYVIKGEICRQQGRDEEALEYYLQASVNGDRDPDFLRLLLQMLYERQRSQEAEQVLRRLDSSQTLLPAGVEHQAAQILALWGNFDRALQSANEAYNPASDNLRTTSGTAKC